MRNKITYITINKNNIFNFKIFFFFFIIIFIIKIKIIKNIDNKFIKKKFPKNDNEINNYSLKICDNHKTIIDRNKCIYEKKQILKNKFKFKN